MNPDNPHPTPHPTIFVIFGITGDWAGRKILPALLGLYSKKQLPEKFAIVGFSRQLLGRDEFREIIRSRLSATSSRHKEEDIKHFLDLISYEQGYFDSELAFLRLSQTLKKIDLKWGCCANKLLHLSTTSNHYEIIITNLVKSKLSDSGDNQEGWTRIIIEKPFGKDIDTARSLEKILEKTFKPEQIFRLDQYLAKSAVINVTVFRFYNDLFEMIWNKKFIDKIHIKLFKKEGIDGGGSSYDQVGAIRSVCQSHLLQLLAVLTMEKPKSFAINDIQRERLRAILKVAPLTPRQVLNSVIRGQYIGYRSEKGVNSQSETETYFRIKANVKTRRWKGVVIYLESGHAMAESKTEIDVYFKSNDGREQNIMTFRIEPDEDIKIRFFVKAVGSDLAIVVKALKYKYSDWPLSFDISDDYGRLISDALKGNQSLFISIDEIIASWKFVMPILENLAKLPLIMYERGAGEV